MAPRWRGFGLRVALPLELDGPTGEFPRALRDVVDAGLAVDVIPCLAGERGVTTRNAARFHTRLLEVLPTLAPDVGVFVFCEPPPRAMQAALSIGAGGLAATARRILDVVGGVPATMWAARQGHRDLRELASDLKTRATLAAVPPPLVPLDSPLRAAAVHWLLGCPEADVDDSPLFGPTAALCCAPLVATDRQGQHRAFTLWAARHREKSHAICLGPTTPARGLPTSATYQAASHLRTDLHAARALGFSDITVLGLEGLVVDPDGAVRADADAWLEAVDEGHLGAVALAA